VRAEIKICKDVRIIRPETSVHLNQSFLGLGNGGLPAFELMITPIRQTVAQMLNGIVRGIEAQSRENRKLRMTKGDQAAKTSTGDVVQGLGQAGNVDVGELQLDGIRAEELSDGFTTSKLVFCLEPHEDGVTNNALLIQQPATKISDVRMTSLADSSDALSVEGCSARIRVKMTITGHVVAAEQPATGMKRAGTVKEGTAGNTVARVAEERAGLTSGTASSDDTSFVGHQVKLPVKVKGKYLLWSSSPTEKADVKLNGLTHLSAIEGGIIVDSSAGHRTPMFSDKLVQLRQTDSSIKKNAGAKLTLELFQGQTPPGAKKSDALL